MHKIMFMILCICLSVSGANGAHSMSRTPPVPAENYYQGNPQTENATLYIYLCRKGCTPTEKKCNCGRCGGKNAGLSLGFICVDESEDTFTGVGPTTSNIIWSMFVAFSEGTNSLDMCHREGFLTAQYFYDTNIYSRIETLDYKNDIIDKNGFLHQTAGEIVEKCLERVDRGYDSNDELRVTRILRSALFRVRYVNFSDNGVPSITQISSLMGNVGENKTIDGKNMRVLVPYNKVAMGGHNCATFCRACLSEIAVFPIPYLHLSPVRTCTALATGGGVGALWGSAISPGIGTAIGFGAGVAYGVGVMAISGFIKKCKGNAPEAVIDDTLDFFQEKYTKKDDDLDSILLRLWLSSSFALVAHDSSYSRFKNVGSNEREANYYNTFELKSISDVIKANVRISKVKGKIFFKEDFEKDEKGSCIIM